MHAVRACLHRACVCVCARAWADATGCAVLVGSGEIDAMYRALAETTQASGPVDLLLCCGDFESIRNEDDLETMACPPKYRALHAFHKYYTGELVAPVLTLFIGGNHEASNFLQELPYGGWVAPRIYFLGYCGCVRVGSLRVVGLSGIYNERDVWTGRFERPPYTPDTLRSVFHVKMCDVARLELLSRPVDVFLSHDWPLRITDHGDCGALLARKPFFRDEIERGDLGSPV